MEKVRLVTDEAAICKVEMKRSGRKRQKNAKETTIFGEDEYLEYLWYQRHRIDGVDVYEYKISYHYSFSFNTYLR